MCNKCSLFPFILVLFPTKFPSLPESCCLLRGNVIYFFGTCNSWRWTISARPMVWKAYFIQSLLPLFLSYLGRRQPSDKIHFIIEPGNGEKVINHEHIKVAQREKELTRRKCHASWEMGQDLFALLQILEFEFLLNFKGCQKRSGLRGPTVGWIWNKMRHIRSWSFETTDLPWFSYPDSEPSLTREKFAL